MIVVIMGCTKSSSATIANYMLLEIAVLIVEKRCAADVFF